MGKEKLEELSIGQLKAKEKSLKVFIGFFVPIIIGLFYFIIQDYFNSGKEVDWSILTIAICTLGGPATLYPELKAVRNEMKARN